MTLPNLTPEGQRLADALVKAGAMMPEDLTYGEQRASLNAAAALLLTAHEGEGAGLREAIVKADLQIGDGHVEAARRTLHAAMDGLDTRPLKTTTQTREDVWVGVSIPVDDQQPMSDTLLRIYRRVATGTQGAFMAPGDVAHLVAEIDRLRAALTKQPAAQEPAAAGVVGWQPIETAPREYQPILLALDRGKHGDINRAPVIAFWSETHGDWAHWHNFKPVGIAATHWSYLPEPPWANLTPAAPKTPDAATGGSVGDGGLREALDEINVHEEADNYELRADGDYTPNDFEKSMLEDFGAGLMAKVYEALAPQPPKAETPAGVGAAITRALNAAGAIGSAPSEAQQFELWNSIVAIRTILSTAPAARPGDEVGRVRHVKRGTEYEVLGEAEAQVSVGTHKLYVACAHVPASFLHDGVKLTVYRDPKSGKLWCRFPDEMRDGRFVLAAAPAADGGRA